MSGRSKHVSLRVDEDLKIKAEAILNGVGISPTQALKMLYTRIVQERGWPCELRVPNELTQSVFAETDRGENLETHNSVREIFEELELEKEIEAETKVATRRNL